MQVIFLAANRTAANLQAILHIDLGVFLAESDRALEA
jgi:hypothetical protein